MVEIREESGSGDEQPARDGNQQPQAGSSRQSAPHLAPGRGLQASLIEFVKDDPFFSICSWLRILTLYFLLAYTLNSLGIISNKTSYSKAFAAAAATNAFRLHQRLRGTNNAFFSRDFLQQLMLEDPAHYLLYSIAFISSAPVTMALFPIGIYALLHTASYVIKTAEVTGHSRSPFVVAVGQFRDRYTTTCLSTAAFTEVFLFPVMCAMILMGKANFLFVFLYYRFLSLRWASRRNPHTRLAFYNLKVSLFDVASKPACPNIVKQFIYQSVNLIQRLAPPIQ
ncbi:Transmembrane protein 33-like protein [Aphelenchoides fujianensis]|nr:Transmembrane protein 33-like protein [Aphelenchoides fujianensis]